MGSFASLSRYVPIAAAAVLAWPQAASAQGLAADYVLQADGRYSGAGLSVEAGRNWFAQVSIGRSLMAEPGLQRAESYDAMRIGGGYRWANGQSLSLQVTGARGPERLGLSLSYDWPRYFVRLSYDSGLDPLPQDRLRFSAGVRF